MGSVICCLQAPLDFEEDTESDDSSHGRNCACPSCFFKNLMNKYGVVFGRREILALPPAIQGTVPSNSVIAPDNAPLYSNSSFGIQLSNDINSRNTEFHSDGVCDNGQRNYKGHSRADPESFRRNYVKISPKWLRGEQNDSSCEGGSKKCHSESSTKIFPEEGKSAAGYFYSSSEDEDVCPTCLEEYTPENPRIITKCNHHYHLGCIYEWKERSESCPMCGKLMIFDETT